MGMHSLVYKGLHNISWYCDLCELPNFSSSLFDTTSFETTNRFDIFNDTPISEGSIGSPTAASSPLDKTPKRSKVKRYDKPLKSCNHQLPVSKKQETGVGKSSGKFYPDIIIGNDSWLNKDMQSSEVFPEGYNCYRKDRKDHTHGGVFVLVSDKYLSTEPPEFRVDGACELLWVKLQIQGLPDLHIGSFYRPPKTTDEAYLTALNHSISKVLYNRNCNVWLGGSSTLEVLTGKTAQYQQGQGIQETVSNLLT